MNLLLPLLLAAAPSVFTERLVDDSLGVELGVQGSAYAVYGARYGDTFGNVALTAQGHLLGLAGELQLLLATPLARNGTLLGFTALARVGWSGYRWSLLGGAFLGVSPGAPGVQVLPTLRAQFQFTRSLGVAAALFDQFGLVPAQLEAVVGTPEEGGFSLGWVVPLGLTACARFPLGKGFGLTVRGFAFRAGNTEVALLTVGGSFGGAR
jgi:hypothetical protein